MTELLPLSGALLAGATLGSLFFGGLWWTVHKGLTSNHPALWFLGSTLLRTSLVIVGFLFISSGDWRKLLACLLGFFIARVFVTRLTRTTTEGANASK
jgi:F1F0 ATPase subunit 2